MSLLMDALKRAEKEREAAKPDKDKSEAADELSLGPTRAEATGAPSPPKEQAEPPQAPDFTLEAREEERTRVQEGIPEEPPVLTEEPNVPAGLEGIPLDEPAPEVSMEETSATMPSMKAVKASVDRYFDGSASTSLTMDSVRGHGTSDDDTTLVRERTIHTQEQQAAQTVFDAKTIPQRRVPWVWVAVIPLLIICLAVGGYYYWTVLNAGPTYTSPGVATQRPLSPTPAGAGDTGGVAQADSAPAAASATDTSTTVVASSTASETVSSSATAPSSTASSESQPMGAEPQDSLMEAFLAAEQEAPSSGDLTPVPEPPPQVADVELAPVEPAPAPEPEAEWMSDEEFAAALARSSGLAQGSMRSDAIKITRRKSAGQTGPMLTSAYQAFQSGDLVAAEATYRKVLAQDARNRDAWLGLGAIAVEAKRWGSATEIYLRLLRLNPRDSVAQAALIALQDNVDPVQGESMVKTALEREPDAPYLHFTLGNLYASQARWAEAQNAYFDAYRLDSQNPDYAFNLAVGLEHLSQRRTAIKYYEKAVELARTHKASFDPMVVKQRIETLSSRHGAE